MLNYSNNNGNFVGFDQNPKISLRKYGFVCRPEKSDQHICIYRVKPDVYDYGFLCESDVNDLLNGKSWLDENEINGFYEKIDQTPENFNSLPFQHKVFALINHFPVEDIMGICFDPMTLNDAEYMIDFE